MSTATKRPDGGTGRRAGFKIQFSQESVGSIPSPGTNLPDPIRLRDGKILLYKQKGSPYWYARLKLKKGWASRSTKHEHQAEAAAVAIALYEGNDFLKRKRTRSFQHYASKYGDTLRAAIEDGSALPIWHTYFSQLVNYIERFFNKYEINEIDDAVLDEFDKWRKNKLGKEPSKTMIGHQNVALRKIFTLAVHDKVLNRRDVPNLTLKDKGRKAERRPSFTRDEYKLLYQKMRTYGKNHPMFITRYKRQLLRNYVLILANTGLRPGKEIETLRWRQIREFTNADGETFVEIVVSEGKTKGRDVIARHTVRKYFDRIKELTGRSERDDLVFCMPDGSPLKDAPHMFTKMLASFGLLYDAKGDARCCYSLRHFYAEQRILTGDIPHLILAQNMGTSVNMLEKHYIDTIKKHMATQLAR